MLIGPAFRPKVHISPLIEESGHEYILLHPDRPCFLAVNRVGYAALKHCEGKKTIHEISALLTGMFDVDQGTVETDLIDFFKSIHKTWLMAPAMEKRAVGAMEIRKLHLNVTHECNLSCLHCALQGGDRTGRLELDEIRTVLRDFRALGGTHVAVSGGEPLLLEGIPDLCVEAAKHFSLSLSTNGLRMTPGLFRRLDRHRIAVHLSMDGAGPEIHEALRGKGAFGGLQSILKLMGEADPDVPHGVYTTLTKINIGDVRRIIGLCRDYGIRRVHFMPLQKMGRAAAHWDRLTPSLKELMAVYRLLYLDSDDEKRNGLLLKGGFQGLVLDFPEGERWCGLGQVLAVDADGGVYPCSLMIAPEFRLGDIGEKSLRDFARSPRLREWVEQCSNRERKIEACRSCSWRNFCQAGCPASNFFLRGTMYDSDDLCDIRRSLYPALIGKRLE